VAQRNLGEVTTQIETIEALFGRYVNQLKDWCKEGKTTIQPEEEARMAAWRASISRSASQVAFRGLELLGGAATYRGDLFEVFARDLFMISIHVGMAYEDHMMYYGRAQYGMSQHPLV
jgi:alkylation response protein AidB-like acyl-CoA dehydrogenase